MVKKFTYIWENRLPAKAPEGLTFRRGVEVYHGDDLEVESLGKDIGKVTDRLLRIAVKLTESNTSDVLASIDGLKEAQELNKPYCEVLAFHDRGVDSYSAGFDVCRELFAFVPEHIPKDSGLRGYQFWLLAYAPGDPEGKTKGRTLLKRYNFTIPTGLAKPTMWEATA